MPDGEEIQLSEEDTTRTTYEIKKTVGDESDFDITILTTAKNLENLIDTTPTESGKLLTKFIGIEVIELKEKIVRKLYNEFSKTMKSNHYNIEDLKSDISFYITTNTDLNNKLSTLNGNLKTIDNDIDLINKSKDSLLSSKKDIDVKITQLNPETLESDIEKIITKGKGFNESIKQYDKELLEIGNVEYNEELYFNLNKEYNIIDSQINVNRLHKKTHLKTIETLKSGEICPTCHRKLDDVNHAKEILNEEDKINNLNNEYVTLETKLKSIKTNMDSMLETKKKVDLKDKTELNKSRLEVDIVALRNELLLKKADLKKYNDNIDAIKYNGKIDIDVSQIKTNIIIKETEKNTITKELHEIENNISNNLKNIESNEKLIKDINAEKEVERLYKIYIEMVGKKGISKLILRSVLPIINSELYRLMEDTCDFEVELTINDKNDVVFLLTRDGIEKKLKSGSGFEKTASSIALRCVLGKMSHLPMPNFITFDEPFGMVADDNLEKMKPMFDKISDMYDIVFLISHLNEVKDWGNNIITIKKNDNISSILIK